METNEKDIDKVIIIVSIQNQLQLLYAKYHVKSEKYMSS